MLLVPRNDGACLWAPSVEGSTTSACTVNTSSFSCHLHTNGLFTLERSKSDVQAYKNLQKEYNAKTKFYIDDTMLPKDATEDKGYALEKSKTSAMFSPQTNHIDLSIFDNRPNYSRAAPSPPVRSKLSPGIRRSAMNNEVKSFTNQGKSLGVMGILDVVPVPPKRKISPKQLDNSSAVTECSSNETLQDKSEDLIQF